MSDASEKWFGIATVAAILGIVALVMLDYMVTMDRFSDCLQRGGEMRKVDDMVQCRLPGAK